MKNELTLEEIAQLFKIAAGKADKFFVDTHSDLDIHNEYVNAIFNGLGIRATKNYCSYPGLRNEHYRIEAFACEDNFDDISHGQLLARYEKPEDKLKEIYELAERKYDEYKNKRKQDSIDFAKELLKRDE